MSLESRRGGLPAPGSRPNVEWPAKANDPVILRRARDISLRHALATGYVVSLPRPAADGADGVLPVLQAVACPYGADVVRHRHPYGGMPTRRCIVSVGALEGVA